MGLFQKIKNALLLRELEGVDPDSAQSTEIQIEILNRKPVLRKVFYELYTYCIRASNEYFTGEGNEIEIGSGVGYIKNFYPHVITTEIKDTKHVDMLLDAQHMNLPDQSVKAFYGLNCFHHFPNPDLFFNELKRTLVKGGGCVLIDPYYGPMASFLYKRLFATEDFNKNQKEWKNTSMNFMKDANQALSYIVFVRDRKIWEKKHPDLEIVKMKVMPNYLKYLLSGGLNFKSLWPTPLFFILSFIEILLWPLHSLLGLHHAIVIRKK
jgi:SAM-dependent methyltransferase